MSQSDHVKIATRQFGKLSVELLELGFVKEPYVVGPTGLGVFRLALSGEVSAYVSFSYFSRHRAIGVYVGFGSSEIKSITDECLKAVGSGVGIRPTHALAQPCPAVLFPLEFFLSPPEGLPFKLSDPLGPRFRAEVFDRILKNSPNLIDDGKKLCDFLASDERPFSWATSEVPRRLVQVAYLLSSQGSGRDVARRLLKPVGAALRGDPDFDAYAGDLVEDVLKYFFQ
jgi:hypothetical protein